MAPSHDRTGRADRRPANGDKVQIGGVSRATRTGGTLRDSPRSDDPRARPRPRPRPRGASAAWLAGPRARGGGDARRGRRVVRGRIRRREGGPAAAPPVPRARPTRACLGPGTRPAATRRCRLPCGRRCGRGPTCSRRSGARSTRCTRSPGTASPSPDRGLPLQRGVLPDARPDAAPRPRLRAGRGPARGRPRRRALAPALDAEARRRPRDRRPPVTLSGQSTRSSG